MTRCSRIVGVVADVLDGITNDNAPRYYLPLAPSTDPQPAWLVVRTDDARTSAGLLARFVDAASPYKSHTVLPVPSLVEAQLSPWRNAAIIAGILSVIAILLAAIGAYGSMAYVVTLRQHEIAVRTAVGASTRALGFLLTRESLFQGAAGASLTAGLMRIAARHVQPILFKTTLITPATMVLVVCGLLLIVVAASIVPLRSATRINLRELLQQG